MEIENISIRELLKGLWYPSDVGKYQKTELLRRLSRADRLEAGIRELMAGWGKRDLLEAFNIVEQLMELLEAKP